MKFALTKKQLVIKNIKKTRFGNAQKGKHSWDTR